jgi:DNA-binding GntR family transcriptional regulator
MGRRSAGGTDRPARSASTSGLRPAPRLMLRESVYESVKRLLMDHDIEPGSRLSIDGLSRDLQVSPTPVREALFRCEAEGLVERRPNAGYVVAPLLDRAALNDLYDVRLLLEPAAAGRAAQRASEPDLTAMRGAIAAMSPAVVGDTYEAYREFAGQDAVLHEAIAKASGSPLIAGTLHRLRAHTHGYRLYFRHGIARDAVAEHQAIMDAIARRDPNAAQEAMRIHLNASRLRLLNAYEED